jgi:hypothetical protein
MSPRLTHLLQAGKARSHLSLCDTCKRPSCELIEITYFLSLHGSQETGFRFLRKIVEDGSSKSDRVVDVIGKEGILGCVCSCNVILVVAGDQKTQENLTYAETT